MTEEIIKNDLFKNASKALDSYLQFSLLTERQVQGGARENAYSCSDKLLNIVKAKIKLIVEAGYLEDFESYLLSENLVVTA